MRLFCITVVCLLFCVAEGDRTVGILVLLTNTSQLTNSLLSVENAVQEVNQRNNGYRLEVNVIIKEDSDGSTIHFSDSFLNSSSPTIGVINGGYSFINLLELTSVPIIFYSPLNTIGGRNTDNTGISVSLTLSNSDVVDAINEFFRFAGWRQVALISEPKDIFLNIEQLLIEKLMANEIKVNEFHVSRTQENITYLYEGSNKIFIVNTFEDVARSILCEAYKNNAYYPKYQWIFYGWYSEDWLLRSTGDEITCTKEEMIIATDRAIVIEQENGTGYPKHIFAQSDSMSNQTKSFDDKLAHDSVITLATYINNSISNNTMFIEECGVYNTISKETFTKCTTTTELVDTEFEGKSGHVSFDENGGRIINSIYYSQYRMSECRYNLSNRGFTGKELCTKLVQIAALHYNNLSIHLIGNQNNTTIWPDGIPYDGSPIEIISVKVLSATIVLYILATLGLLFTLSFLIFNIVFRKRKVVRLTSPNLNYFIIIGATILYGSIYPRMARTSSTNFWIINCHVIIWTLYLGYAFCLSPYFGKLWRLYYICHNPTTKKKKIQDWHLVVFVIAEVSIVLLMLVVGSLIPYTRPQFYLGEDLENRNFTNEDGIEVHFVSVNCFSTLSFLLNSFGILFFSIQHAIAIYFALKIRKVKIKVLNEYKELSATLYITTIAMIQGLACSVILQNFETIVESFISTAIFVTTTIFVGFAFIPKVRSLYKDPRGENIFKDIDPRMIETGNITLETHNEECIIEQNRIKALEDKIVQLNQELTKQRET